MKLYNKPDGYYRELDEQNRQQKWLADVLAPFFKVAQEYDYFPKSYIFERFFELYDMPFIGDENEHEIVDGYFRECVVPHKIHVLKAGMKMIGQYGRVGTKAKALDKDAFFKQLLWHDMSKFSKQEEPYAFHVFNGKRPSWNPNGYNLPGFEQALQHHFMVNEHHPAYYYTYKPENGMKCLPMPYHFIMEMIADWTGAGVTYGSKLDTWFEANIHKYAFHKETMDSLVYTMDHIFFSAHESSILTYMQIVDKGGYVILCKK